MHRERERDTQALSSPSSLTHKLLSKLKLALSSLAIADELLIITITFIMIFFQLQTMQIL
jgi:hypothetical protein